MNSLTPTRIPPQTENFLERRQSKEYLSQPFSLLEELPETFVESLQKNTLTYGFVVDCRRSPSYQNKNTFTNKLLWSSWHHGIDHGQTDGRKPGRVVKETVTDTDRNYGVTRDDLGGLQTLGSNPITLYNRQMSTRERQTPLAHSSGMDTKPQD